MKAAFVITFITAISYSGSAHIRETKNIQNIQGHSSESEGSQSLAISSRAKLNQEKLPSDLSQPYEMEMVDGTVQDEDSNESYVLVPLKNLVRNSRSPTDKSSEEEKDPLYVMFPYREIAHRTLTVEEPKAVNVSAEGARIKRSQTTSLDHPHVRPREKRKSSIARMIDLAKSKSINNRFQEDPNSNKRKEQPNPSKLGMGKSDKDHFSESLLDVPLVSYLKDPFSLDQISGAQYKKSKKSLGVSELRSQSPPNLLNTIGAKPRILTDIRGWSPKAKDLQSIVVKPKKSSSNAINITMYISNLVSPCDVENTRITNSGKLSKNGCLKFSIQLEKPVCPDENGDDSCNAPESPLSVPQRAGNELPEHTNEEKGSPAMPAQSGAGRPLLGGNIVYPEASHAAMAANNVKASPTPHNVLPTEKTPAQGGNNLENGIDSNPTANRDVTALLMQLMGMEKKAPKKTMYPTQAQAVFMDNDIVKELQKLITSNQGSPGQSDIYRGNPPGIQTQTPSAQHNQKAKAIADALNFFSKISSVRQNNKLINNS